jgi:predicted nucleic acid-binding Zn ribbon protein
MKLIGSTAGGSYLLEFDKADLEYFGKLAASVPLFALANGGDGAGVLEAGVAVPKKELPKAKARTAKPKAVLQSERQPRPCAVCGKPIPADADPRKRCCSEACEKERERKWKREYAARQGKSDRIAALREAHRRAIERARAEEADDADGLNQDQG